MKHPPLTSHDKTRFLIACIELPPIDRLPRSPDYMRDLFITVLDFHMRWEVVAKAITYFLHHVQVQHDVHTHDRIDALLSAYPDSREGNSDASLFLWNNRHWQRAHLLRGLLAFLRSVGVKDQASLHAWAKQADFERDFEGKVPGLGLAIFQWLLIRCGVATVKPDVWVFRFAHRILGRKLSDRAVVALFNEMAPYFASSMSKIDASIWAFERMNLAAKDVPALRIVFWHQVKQRIEQWIMADAGLQAGQWIIAIDDLHALRYDPSGLHMTGSMRLPGDTQARMTHIDLTQTIWHDGFQLRVTLRRDQTDDPSVRANWTAAMTNAGWNVQGDAEWVATLGLDMNTMMAPEIDIVALLERVEAVAIRTVALMRDAAPMPIVVESDEVAEPVS